MHTHRHYPRSPFFRDAIAVQARDIVARRQIHSSTRVDGLSVRSACSGARVLPLSVNRRTPFVDSRIRRGLFLACACAALVIAIITCVASCRLPSSTEPLVTNLRFAPSAFDSFERNTELKYTLKESATIAIRVVRRDSADTLIKSLCSSLQETPGTHAHTWLGDNAAGFFAPAGEYVAILTANGERSEATVTLFHY